MYSHKKSSVIEIIILFMGVVIGFAGFLMINTLYKQEGTLSWEMVLSVFSWLTVFGIIILCSLIYYNLKFHLEETAELARESAEVQKEMVQLLKKK
ncbi:hypothetical protein HQ529_05910 [Candidatus Woesearchaeota archaeon]|nr:hypothetical protein [Candidatus Woesearchaeota archaeon]